MGCGSSVVPEQDIDACGIKVRVNPCTPEQQHNKKNKNSKSKNIEAIKNKKNLTNGAPQKPRGK